MNSLPSLAVQLRLLNSRERAHQKRLNAQLAQLDAVKHFKVIGPLTPQMRNVETIAKKEVQRHRQVLHDIRRDRTGVIMDIRYTPSWTTMNALKDARNSLQAAWDFVSDAQLAHMMKDVERSRLQVQPATSKKRPRQDGQDEPETPIKMAKKNKKKKKKKKQRCRTLFSVSDHERLVKAQSDFAKAEKVDDKK
jgi:hypothetical protein